jgi:acetate kinase
MGIIACGKVFGKNVKQIAVFDTSFHRHLAPKAYLYPLPYDMYQKHQIRFESIFTCSQ